MGYYRSSISGGRAWGSLDVISPRVAIHTVPYGTDLFCVPPQTVNCLATFIWSLRDSLRTPNAKRQTPNAKRQTPNAERRTPNALTPDKDTRSDQERHPNDARKINRPLGEAQPSAMVERHRRKHLACDQQDDKGRSSELRDKEDGKANEDCPEQSTSELPPRDAPRCGRGRDRVA